MKTEKAFVGAVVLDSYPFSQSGTYQQALDMKSTGVDGIAGYLGVINSTRLNYILDVGLAFMPVTLASNAFDGDKAVNQCKSLGITNDCTVWIDLEGMSVYNTPSLELMTKANASLLKIKNAKYQPGIYVGAPQPLSSIELFQLAAVRYWKGIGRCVDRSGKLAEPTCGWSMVQAFHGIKDGMGMIWKDIDPSKCGREWKNTGVFVDPNMITADYYCRIPNWVVA